MRRLIVAALIVLLHNAVVFALETPRRPELTDADRAFLDKKIIARWNFKDPAEIGAAYHRGVDILDHHPDARKGWFRILVDQHELSDLLDDGYNIEVEIADWYQYYAQKNASTIGGFPTFDEAMAQVDVIHAAHPTITTARFSIGQSFLGDTLWAIKVSDNPEVDESEMEILFTGLHHAREPASMAVILETLDRLTSGYGTDSLATLIVDNREVYFVPCVNPDGYKYNQIIAPTGGGMWRLNRNSSYSVNIGVDLNRNYGYNWGFDDEGSSSIPGSETYRGPFAFSEPETQAMRAFINAHEFIFAMNFHSYSDLYLWPWGFQQGLYAPDDEFFREIGDSMAIFNGYTAQVGWELYPTNGDSDDWAYGATNEHPKIYSFTPEVGGNFDGFWPSFGAIPGIIEENQEPNFVLMSWDVPEIDADVLAGDAPLTVNFIDASRHYPDTRLWDLGDGDTTSTQHPTHIYNAGLYTVSLTTTSPFGTQTRTKVDYITAAAESLVIIDDSAMAGDQIVIPINVTNHVPLTKLLLPISVTNIPTYATLDSVSRVGTRTDNFESQQALFNNIFFGEIGVRLTANLSGSGAPPLAPGSGPVANVYLTLKPGAMPGGQIKIAIVDVLGSVVRGASSPALDFDLFTDSAALSILPPPCECSCHGDPQCDSIVDVFDVVAVVDLAFRSGSDILDPLPQCTRTTTDVNCDDLTDVFDVVSLVDVAFRNADPNATFCDPCL